MRKTRIVASIVLAVSFFVLTANLQAQNPQPPSSKPATAPASGPATTPATSPITITGATKKITPIVTTQSQPTTYKADTLDDCEALYMKGQYTQAAEGYRKLAAKHPLAAALGLADALKIEGQYAKAVEALTAVAEDGKKDAAWNVAMSELQTLLSEYEKALDFAAKAHELRPDWSVAVYAHGQALETLGRRDQALEVYKNLDGVLKEDSYRKDPRSMVAVGQIMERHTVLSGKKASDQATNILQNYLQQAYMGLDKKYWPANLAAGMFLLQNYRPNQAMSEFNLAAKINPRIPDVFVGTGVAALGAFNFEACIKQADEALKINPNHADALLLKGACMMQWRKFDEVDQYIQKVLAFAPNHMEALSLQAALFIRQHQEDKAKPIIEKVLKINPKCSGLYNTIGEWLASGRQFKDAETYYLKAIELCPELAEPHANLGLMYMQVGDEVKAQEALTKAHSINDFREDVANYLDLVKELLDPSKYLVRETAHFVVKVNAEFDSVLLDQVSDYMEGIYPEIVKDYGYEPQGKTIIEIFPTHAKFSVRISGKGWVGTIGACTGNLIALSAPVKDRQGASGTANWAVVLRHEYTHAVTLAATNNRIPHWFTEACAVFQQPDKRAYRYIQTLVTATRTNKLFPVKDLDWGFIRPKAPGDRELAYAQSEWILQYIIIKYGYDPTVVNMIHAFRDGLTQKQVFEQLFKTTEEQFDKDFSAWAHEQIKDWKFDPEPPPDFKKATDEAKNKPNDAPAQANLAIALLNARQAKPAEAAANKALSIDANNTQALGVLGYCQMMEKKYDDAIRTAKRLEEASEHNSVHAPRILAQCYLEKRQWPEAIASLELFKQRQPLDQYSYTELARIYTDLGQPAKALPNLIEMHKMTMNDSQYARRIADIYRSLGQPKNALEFYRQSTYIDPYEATIYEAMASIYLNDKQYDKAVNTALEMTLLQPDSADAWHKTAAVEYWAAKGNNNDQALLKKAKEAAEKALKIDADGPAKELLPLIEKEIKQ